MRITRAIILVTVVTGSLFAKSLMAQGTSFTYQGSLLGNGAAASGEFDMEFYLRDAQSGGNPVGATNTLAPVVVSSGLFTVQLDFGTGIFTGPQRWLEIGVRTNGSIAAYTILSPRQPFTAAPYALYAPNSASAATAASVASSAVSAPQLNTAGAPAAGQILSYTGTGLAWTNPAAANGSWLLSGNGGTSTPTDFLGTTDGQPLQIRATGGINFFTGTNRLSLAGQPGLDFGNSNRQMLNLNQAAYGIGVQDMTLYLRTVSDFSWFIGGGHTNRQNDPGPGIGSYEQMRLDGSGDLNVRRNVIANSITLSSDRNLKENFGETDPLEVLAKVAALPITSWSFKQSPGERHLGPMAQDFYSSFGLGTDERHIAVLDEGGVALAAIQGLNQRLQEKDAQIEKLTREITELSKVVRLLQESKGPASNP
jgi:hypothetical protein